MFGSNRMEHYHKTSVLEIFLTKHLEIGGLVVEVLLNVPHDLQI